MSFTMLSNFVLILMVVHGAYGYHFRGGAMSWKPLNNGQQVELTYRVGFTFVHTENRFDPCTEAAKKSQTLLGTSGYLTCELCPEHEKRIRLFWKCTDYDEDENWAMGGNVVIYDVPSGLTQFEIKHEECCWLKTLVSPNNPEFSANGWNMATLINVAPRESTGIINSSPVSALIPLEKFYRGCVYNLTIAVTDPDNDIVQCRNMKANECPTHKGWSKACGIPTSGLTVKKDCRLVFNTQRVEKGHHAVNILIKDCPDKKCKIPYSKVPLLFLLEVADDSETCMKPSVILPSGCKTVRPGHYFGMEVMAESGDPMKPISKIISQKTVSNMKSSEMSSVPGHPNRKAITFSWTPAADLDGDYYACFSALDSDGYTSGSSCALIHVTNAPLLHVDLDASTPGPNSEIVAGLPWVIQFNAPIIRPTQTAYIRLVDENGEVIHEMDAAKSTELTYNDRSIEFYLPDMAIPLFPGQSATYSLRLDDGIGVPADGGCSSLKSNWNVDVTGEEFRAENCDTYASQLGLSQLTCAETIAKLPDKTRACCRCFDTLYGAQPPGAQPPGKREAVLPRR